MSAEFFGAEKMRELLTNANTHQDFIEYSV